MTYADELSRQLTQVLATVSTTEAAEERPMTSGWAAWGLPYASRDVTLTAMGCAGIAAVIDAVNTLMDAQGAAGRTVKLKGDPATLLPVFALLAAKVLVPITPSAYEPLVVAMYDNTYTALPGGNVMNGGDVMKGPDT